jgi:hypothetical protein
MMKKQNTFIASLALLLLPVCAFSQTPTQTTIESNNVKAVIRSDGTIFNDGQQGVFIPVEPGLAFKSLIGHAGLWLAGIDPGGNLVASLQVNNKTDFQTGILDEDGNPTANLSNIWQVTCSDIKQDLADFQDNGVIDNPNPNVFAYPGKQNPYFEQYNAAGQMLANTKQAFAGFFDGNGTGTYDPQKGDYPTLELRGCPANIYPKDQRWFAFNDATNHPSLTPSMHMEVQTQMFTFKTQSPSLFNNTVFVRYKLINRAYTALDSCFFGLYADFDIGNPGDDFMGTMPDQSIVYGYNGDSVDEGGFGAEMPVMAMKIFRGPLGVPDANGNQYEADLKSMVIFDNTDSLSTLQCYRLLSGRQKDGSVIPGGSIMYPGNPNDPGAASEVKAGNTPGKRAAVASFGPFKLEPGAVNEIIVAYYYVYAPGKTALENVQSLYDQKTVLQGLFDGCFEGMLDNDCDLVLTAPTQPQASGLMLMPNPAQTSTLVQQKSGTFNQVDVIDMLGRVVRSERIGQPVQEYRLETGDLQSGIYGVRVNGKVLELAVVR